MLDLLGIPSPSDVWADITAFFTLSAFWLYLFYGALIIIGAAALAWLFPVLRSLAGAVILSVVGMLYAYRRGENDATRRADEKRKRDEARRRPPPQDHSWWRW